MRDPRQAAASGGYPGYGVYVCVCLSVCGDEGMHVSVCVCVCVWHLCMCVHTCARLPV